VYLVQREVAERLAASPGSKAYGALSVNVQAHARVEALFRVPAGAFHPPPRVDSALVRLTPRAEPAVPPEREERYRTFVQEAFSLRRKQMRRVVRTIARLDPAAADEALASCAIDPEIRPETLSPEQFARLVEAIEPQA
jgi:16S rRNA (adenine1518-N6/adenine1519-N6)-dimethyltransferase